MRYQLMMAVVLLARSICAQEPLKPMLIDSTERSSCEDYLARTDNFGIALQKDPAAQGIIVWYGVGEKDGRMADHFAKFMHRSLINRFSNNLKVTVLRSNEETLLRADLWLVPKGVEHRIPNTTISAEIPFTVTKRTLFAISTGDPCSNYDFDGLANVLLSNPDLNGVLVDVGTARSDRRDDAAEIIRQFREMKIPRERLRLFFRRSTANDRELGEHMELWLVPRKMRK